LEDDVVKILPRFYVVQSADDDWKLEILAEGYVLNSFAMCGDFHSWAPLAHKLGNGIGLGMADVFLPEHELPVQIGEVDCVHIHQVDVAHSA
jgi:hypothetical protein